MLLLIDPVFRVKANKVKPERINMNNNKNILSLAPFFADDYVEARGIVFDLGQYQRFIKDNKKRLGLFSKYLICKLHDSEVMSVNIYDDLFSVTLNDFSTRVFADAIIRKKQLNIEYDKLVFPVQMDFTTIARVEFNEVDDEGNLTPVEPVQPDEYLYEQVASIDHSKIELVFLFWKKFQDHRPGKRLVLLVSATDIVVSERQDAAWQQIFGADFDEYYQEFKQHFDSDRYVSDLQKCLELIDEYDVKKNGATG